jgi:hypothetical protein
LRGFVVGIASPDRLAFELDLGNRRTGRATTAGNSTVDPARQNVTACNH